MTNKSLKVKKAIKMGRMYEDYILKRISFEDYDYPEAKNNKELLQQLWDTFYSEYCYENNLKRYGSYCNVMRE